MNPILLFKFFVVSLILFLSFCANGQTFPSGFTQVSLTDQLTDPTSFVFTPGGGRIFVTEQGGDLRVIKNGLLLPTPAVHIVVNSDGERGLLGVVLDPNFSTNQYLYLYYTVPSPRHNRISRFTMTGDLISLSSEVVVLDLDPLSSATNHNGGSMAFGPDGKLYIGVGENANGANAQNLDTYLGKILRINSNGSVPSGNPFTTGSAQKKRIWAYGLRNPYTFTFQPGTGILFVNDVGQSSWEEINDATNSGHNFGWPSAEGISTNLSYTNPVYAYEHGNGDGLGCAITGGAFFNPDSTTYPNTYAGKYFFMDLCERWINYIDPTAVSISRTSFATGIGENSLGLRTGPDGNLYYLSRTDKALYKIIYGSTTNVQNAESSIISNIYPQPANEILYIELDNEPKGYTAQFINSDGKLIPVPFTFENSKLVINTSSLPAGIYAARIEGNNKIFTKHVSIIK
jgi:glucose/arabinose dehydrogenase